MAAQKQATRTCTASTTEEGDPRGDAGAPEQSKDEKTKLLVPRFLDAHALDEYLFQLLLPRFTVVLCGQKPNDVLTLPQLKWMALPLLRLISLLSTIGQTPATNILGLKFTSAIGADTQISRWNSRFLVYVVASTILPAVYERLSQRLQLELDIRQQRQQQQQQQQQPSSSSSLAMETVALTRQRKVLQVVRRFVDRISSLARLGCLLLCWRGFISTPSLAMAMTRYTFQPKDDDDDAPPPRLHVDYAHRRWLQEQTMSTARIIFAGFWMTDTWQPVWQDWIQDPVSRFLSRLRPPLASLIMNRHNAAAADSITICPICNAHPIHMPFTASPCGHTYCYTCLYKESLRVNPVCCWICSKPILRSAPMWFPIDNNDFR